MRNEINRIFKLKAASLTEFTMASISDLPNEILLIIFHFCDKKGSDLRLVCQRWNDLILNEFSRYFDKMTFQTERDLLRFFEKSRIRGIDSLAIEMSSFYLPSSTLFKLTPFSAAQQENFQLKNLTEIEISEYDDADNNYCLEFILNNSRNLTKLRMSQVDLGRMQFSEFGFLTDLTIFDSKLHSDTFFGILMASPLLGYFKMVEVEVIGPLQDVDSLILSETLDNLKTLILVEVEPKLCRQLFQVIPKTLEQLDFSNDEDGLDDDIDRFFCDDDIFDQPDKYNPLEDLVEREIQLKSLEIDGMYYVSQDELVFYISRMKSLEVLHIGLMMNLDNAHMREIKSAIPNLNYHHVNISENQLGHLEIEQ